MAPGAETGWGWGVMSVLAHGSRDTIDRIAAAVGGVAFLLGIVAMAFGAFAPAVAAPTAVSTTVVSSPIPPGPNVQATFSWPTLPVPIWSIALWRLPPGRPL